MRTSSFILTNQSKMVQPIKKERFYSIYNLLTSDFSDGCTILRELVMLQRYVHDPRLDTILVRMVKLCEKNAWISEDGYKETRTIAEQLQLNSFMKNAMTDILYRLDDQQKTAINFAVQHYKSYIIHMLLLNLTFGERVWFNCVERNNWKQLFASMALLTALIFVWSTLVNENVHGFSMSGCVFMLVTSMLVGTLVCSAYLLKNLNNVD